MATVNKRVKKPQAHVINGIDAGGGRSIRYTEGCDDVAVSAPDGLEVPVRDKSVQFVRGTVISQDWVHAVELLTGTVGTYVFYECKSGVAPATGYIMHTLTNPVIHRIRIEVSSGAGNNNYATVTFDFECKAADETKTITDMHAITDDQTAPTYVSAARGGIRIEAAAHGATTIYHTTAFEFSIAMNLVKACNDGDVGYTCVEAELDNMQCSGSISFQDSTITAGALLAQGLATAAAAALVLTVRQGQGATAKTVTVAGADFGSLEGDSGAQQPFTDYRMPFAVANNTGTPLTLSGDNKILTIADAA